MTDAIPPDADSTTTVRSALQADPALAEELGVPPDSGPELRVLKVDRALVRSRPILFAADVLVMAGSLAGLIWAAAFADADVRWSLWLFLMLGLGALAVLGVWKIRSMCYSLEITNKRSIRRIGLLSKDTSEVLHDNIRNFQLRQTAWERVWRVGSIGIASAGQDQVEIRMDKLPRPDRIRELIDLYRPLG